MHSIVAGLDQRETVMAFVDVKEKRPEWGKNVVAQAEAQQVV
jgi:hypothetical protein